MSEETGLPRAERVTRMSADEAKELLSRLTGHPASEIHGYAYLLTRPDGSALCHGSNGLAIRDEVLLFEQAITVMLAQQLREVTGDD